MDGFYRFHVARGLELVNDAWLRKSNLALIDTPLLIWDQGGRCVYANPVAARLLGIKAGDLPDPKGVAAHLFGQSGQISRALAGLLPTPVDVNWPRGGGEILPLHVRTTPLFNLEGHPVGAVSLLSERIWPEVAGEGAEITEAARDAAPGRGAASDEAVTSGMGALFDQAAVKETAVDWGRRMAPGKGPAVRAGELEPLGGQWRVTPRAVEEDLPLDFYQAALQLVGDVTGAALILFDLEGRIAYLSEKAARKLGVKQREAAGRRLEDIAPDTWKDHGIVRQTFEQMRSFEVQIDRCALTGQRGIYRLRTFILADGERRPVGVGLHLEGQSEENLRFRRMAQVGEVATQATHELRNLLTTVRGFLQLAVEQVAAGEAPIGALRQQLAVANAEIDRATELSQSILALARSGPSRPDPLDLGPFFESVHQLIANDAAQRGIVIKTNVAAETPPVYVDGTRLRQVLLNLCRNAFEAMPEGGELLLSAHPRRRGRRVVVEVTDTGQGIPPELQQKIFDPFFTTKEQGTGLGLSLCRQIVEEQGGRIKVTSTVGEGTTFRLELPMVAGSAH